MANTFRKIYKKTGNSGSSSDYQLVGNVGVDGVELDIMKGVSSSTDGEIGLVPKPTKGQENNLLQGNGTWVSPENILKATSLIGNTDISEIGDGSVTGILDTLNNEKMTLYTSTSSSNFKGLYFLIQNR